MLALSLPDPSLDAPPPPAEPARVQAQDDPDDQEEQEERDAVVYEEIPEVPAADVYGAESCPTRMTHNLCALLPARLNYDSYEWRLFVFQCFAAWAWYPF